MNKCFWDEMVKVWCKVSQQIDTNLIQKIAAKHAESDNHSKAGYPVNPLDDDEDDEEDW